MIEYEYLKFLNIQYWYCVVYSLFGGKCTTVEESAIGTVLSEIPAEIHAAPAAPTAPVDFWGWLFGAGKHSGVSVTETVPHTGLFWSIIDGIVAVGAVFSGVFSVLWAIYSAIAYTVSGILILLILGAFVGLAFIRSQELSVYGTLPPRTSESGQLRSRWQQLLDYAISTDPKEWRTGILDADAMLGELLEKIGYPGETVADRLRAVPEGAFVTLPNAWEAHRIRNFVASRASDYILTQREAFRVMKLYEQVFEEFDFI